MRETTDVAKEDPVERVKRMRNIRFTEKGYRIVSHINDVHTTHVPGCPICEELVTDFPDAVNRKADK